MRKPRAVRPGDRVAVVAPASNCERAAFDRGVAELRRLGFEPIFEESVFERTTFTAGTAESRAAAFLDAWRDPSIAALIAVRGGYGSVHLLPSLAHTLTGQPKLFIGYSDNTSILTFLTCQRGVSALHGPMLDGRLSIGADDGYDERSLIALMGDGAGLELAPDGLTVLQAGEIAGPLFGGTLSQLTASLGTPFAFDPPPGAILFIEDVNERPYRLDRMLTHLQFAGVLAKASALVFGEMRGCDEPGGKVTALDVAHGFARALGVPALFGFPSGHTTGPCWTIPLGVRCRVRTAPRPALIVEESPVE